MKRLFILYYLVCVSFVNANAQDITKDFFKALPKKDVKSDTIRSGGANDSIPYINPNGDRVKQNDILIVDSNMIGLIHKSIFILRQDYSLYNRKKNTYYGYNDQGFFGTTYSLVVKCKKFSLLSDEAVHPWKYDTKYLDFKENKLEPQITKSQVLLLDDKISYSYTELDSIFIAQKIIRNDLLYAGKQLTSFQEGLQINCSDTCKTGILVWIVKKSGSLENGDVKIDFKCSRLTVDMFGNVAIVPPSDAKNLIGCVYMTKSGCQENNYLLSGIATLQEQQWVLTFPFKDFKLEEAKEQQKKPKEKGRLTEIKKSNRKN